MKYKVCFQIKENQITMDKSMEKEHIAITRGTATTTGQTWGKGGSCYNTLTTIHTIT